MRTNIIHSIFIHFITDTVFGLADSDDLISLFIMYYLLYLQPLCVRHHYTLVTSSLCLVEYASYNYLDLCFFIAFLSFPALYYVIIAFFMHVYATLSMLLFLFVTGVPAL